MSKLLILAATPNRKDSALSTSEIATAGAMSAIPTTLVAAPVERAKVLLQVQGQGGNSTRYTGVFDVLRHLHKEGGIRSVFRGSIATIIRDGPGSAAFVPSPLRSCAYIDAIMTCSYFAAYEVTKKWLTPTGSKDLSVGAVIFAGGTAGVAMWTIAIPPDVCIVLMCSHCR